MIQPSDAYELPEDLFGREAIAKKIKDLLESNLDLSPFVIDGEWGVGKTTFCRRLIKQFESSNKLNCVYIDAFRADHVDDPLVSIIAEIGKLVEKDGNDSKLDSFIDGAKPFLRTAAKTIGKAAVSIALKQSTDDIAEGYEKEVEAMAGASIDASIDLIIRDKINAEKNLKTLHDALKEVTKEKELVILIDELDRCRATFAIDMLETIKHAFSIPRVKIVLIANASHLETSFGHRYGSNNDTKSYFEKFYNYKYSLPLNKTSFRNSQEYINHHSFKYFQSLLSKSIKIQDGYHNGLRFKSGIEHLIKYNKISLREIEALSRSFEIIFILDKDDDIFQDETSTLISTVAIYLYTKDSNLTFQSDNEIELKRIKRLLAAPDITSDKNTQINPIQAISYIINNSNSLDSDTILLKAVNCFGYPTDEAKKYILSLFKEVYETLKLDS